MTVTDLVNLMTRDTNPPQNQPPGWSGDLFRMFRELSQLATSELGTSSTSELEALPQDQQISLEMAALIEKINAHMDGT